MTIQQDFQLRPHLQRDFTSTGVVGPDYLVANMTGNLRVVVENVGGGNTIQVKGRLAGQTNFVTLDTIVGPSTGTTVDISVVDEIQFNCSVYAASGGTPKLVASGFFKQASGGGGGGSINDGANVGTAGEGVYDGVVGDTLNFRKLNSLSPEIIIALDAPNQKIDFSFDEGAIAIQDLDGVTTFDNNTIVGVDNSGEVGSIPGFNLDTNSGGYNIVLSDEPNGETGGPVVHNKSFTIDPIAASPGLTWQFNFNQMNIDTQNDGFAFGTNGTAVRLLNNNVSHTGLSDIGGIEFIQNNFNLGNGTDPIDVKGIGYAFGFGTINANVNISGFLQGYGFQMNVDAAATIDPSIGIRGFYDNMVINCPSTSYESFTASPTLSEIINNKNYLGFNINPTIDDFTGNASFFGVNVNGNLGDFGTGQFYGVNINPTIDLINTQAYGLYVTMDNVTLYAGTQSSLVIQDLTITFIAPGDNDTYQIEYLDTTTAGSETATLAGNLITVNMESGVSTATQIKAAIEANFTLVGALTVTISGVASNPQNAQAATNFTGGNNPGTKQAAYLDGDVEITGSLTFGGALSIGKLSAFDSQAIVDSGGTPASVHGLIAELTVADNLTIANDDTFGTNTAALMVIGDNVTLTSGPLNIGLAGLGLPAVISVGASSSVEDVSGAVFALSLDSGAGAGGSIDNVKLCSATAIPNGITTVTELKGYNFYLPFGDPGTTTWGVYMEPATAHNFMAGDLIIGDSDVPTNSSVGLEIDSVTKAMLLSRMTTAERDALTAVNGMILYNTTLNKVQVYEGGAWVSVI